MQKLTFQGAHHLIGTYYRIMNYILLSEKKWHNILFENLNKQIPANWILINKKEDFTKENISKLKPIYIFIPHWSYIISKDIYDEYKCVVFHMTDLPYGRGGTPLQNLITNGHDSTMISAIKVSKGIDTGPVYLKFPLSLNGTAEEIFIRATYHIEKMINKIIMEKIEPKEQEGEIVNFERRKLEDGNIINCKNINEFYDFIRMLDCEGYPNAFLEIGKFKLEFNRASLKSNKIILADVRISEK